MREYVCKHCGSDEIYAEGTVRSDATESGEIVDNGNGPEWKGATVEESGSFEDFELDDYKCANCGKGNWKLGELVVVKATRSVPCGRCEHGVELHEQARGTLSARASREGFTRPPWPCTVEGCGCHDFYEVVTWLHQDPNPAQVALNL